jgi:peptide/nickel transport system permease protein
MSAIATELAGSVPAPPVKTSLLKRVLKRPIGAISLAFIVLLALVAAFGPLLAPYDPNTASLHLVLAPPSAEHLLGADSAGHDVLSRLLTATRITILGGLLALVVALAIGVPTGLIAGYFKGWVDTVGAWFTALVIAIPSIIVLLAVRAVVGPSVWTAMFVFGIMLSPNFYRLVDAAVTAVRQELYIDAAKVSGLTDSRIIARHILSVVRAPVIVQSAIIAFIAIAIQSGLEFIGMGDMNLPTWGGMLNDGFANIYRAPLLMLWPALLLALTSIALTLLANVMRDVLERTVVVRRRRRRAIATQTGSVATVTRPIRTSPKGAHQFENELDELEAAEFAGPIVHDDDAHGKQGAEVLLRVRDLRVGYDQDGGSVLEVVHGISLDIRRGEIHGLIGESGSGKSQTAFSVLGLLPRGGHITGGAIEYDGTRLDTASDAELARIRGTRIAYVPQEPMSNLDPSFTIGSQLIEPLRIARGLSKQEATELSLDLLARVGIPDPKRTFDSYPFQVSGGMAQRVLIAGAVSTEPDLIIADEPTTALDVTVQAEVLDLLRDLQSEKGLAIMLVTHNFGVVADLCDRVSVMQAGRIIETGPVRRILGNPEHPYTQSLLEAILDEGPARPALGTKKEAIR